MVNMQWHSLMALTYPPQHVSELTSVPLTLLAGKLGLQQR